MTSSEAKDEFEYFLGDTVMSKCDVEYFVKVLTRRDRGVTGNAVFAS